MAFVSTCFHVLNSLKFKLLPKNCPRESGVVEGFCMHMLVFWLMLQ
jgi:hypothetical protein